MRLLAFVWSCGIVLCCNVLCNGQIDDRRDIVHQLKLRTNQFRRQLDAQLGKYRSEINENAKTEIKDVVFAFGEVVAESGNLLQGLRALFESSDPVCVQQVPYHPDQIATEADLELGQCCQVAEDSLKEAIAKVTDKIDSKSVESWNLDTFVQSRVLSRFGRISESELSGINQEIHRSNVVWDNVQSLSIYGDAKNLNGHLFDVGSYAFICAMNARNSLFRKLKETEDYLNSNC